MKRQKLPEKIIKLLIDRHLLSALDIVRLLDTDTGRYNKTSIYRALEKLLNSNTVCKHTFGGNEAQYELRDHHHDHLLCTHCGRITQAECQVVIPNEIQGFQVQHHHLTLYGLCYDCSLTQSTDYSAVVTE